MLKINGLNKTFGDGLFSIFSGKKKKNNGAWDVIKQKSLIGDIGKIPGAVIKCTVSLDKELKKDDILEEKDRDFDSTSSSTSSSYIPNSNIYSNKLWSTAHKVGGKYIFDKIKITKSYLEDTSNELIACKFIYSTPIGFEIFEIFLNIKDKTFINSNKPEELLNDVGTEPYIIKYETTDNDPNDQTKYRKLADYDILEFESRFPNPYHILENIIHHLSI